MNRIAARLVNRETEQLVILLFDEAGRYISESLITSGEDGRIVGRFRPLIEQALQERARSVVLAHNHPSGEADPSLADIIFTQNFARICTPLEICLVDHLIFAGERVSSLRLGGFL